MQMIEKMRKFIKLRIYTFIQQAENYSNAIMSRMASAYNAYEVGGIPEQIIPLNEIPPFFKKNNPTGVLAECSNYYELIKLLVFLKNDGIRENILKRNKIIDNLISIFCNGYLNWYAVLGL